MSLPEGLQYSSRFIHSFVFIFDLQNGVSGLCVHSFQRSYNWIDINFMCSMKSIYTTWVSTGISECSHAFLQCSFAYWQGLRLRAGDVFQAVQWHSSQHSLQQSTVIKNKTKGLLLHFCTCPLLQFILISFDFTPLHVKQVYHVIFLMP